MNYIIIVTINTFLNNFLDVFLFSGGENEREAYTIKITKKTGLNL